MKQGSERVDTWIINITGRRNRESNMRACSIPTLLHRKSSYSAREEIRGGTTRLKDRMKNIASRHHRGEYWGDNTPMRLSGAPLSVFRHARMSL